MKTIRRLVRLLLAWLSEPRWSRAQFTFGVIVYLLIAAVPLTAMSCSYKPEPAKHAALGCGYCMVAANTGPVWLHSCGCDEEV